MNFIKKTLKIAVIAMILIVIVALIIPDKYLEDNDSSNEQEVTTIPKQQVPEADVERDVGTITLNEEFIESEASIKPLIKVGISDFNGMKYKNVIKKLGNPYSDTLGSPGQIIYKDTNTFVHFNKGKKVIQLNIYKHYKYGENWDAREMVVLDYDIPMEGTQVDVDKLLKSIGIKKGNDMEVTSNEQGSLYLANVNKDIYELSILSDIAMDESWVMKIKFNEMKK